MTESTLLNMSTSVQTALEDEAHRAKYFVPNELTLNIEDCLSFRIWNRTAVSKMEGQIWKQK